MYILCGIRILYEADKCECSKFELMPCLSPTLNVVTLRLMFSGLALGSLILTFFITPYPIYIRVIGASQSASEAHKPFCTS